MADALEDYVNLEELRETPLPVARESAVVTIGDVDAIVRELQRAADEMDDPVHSAGYVDGARHFEQALKHRLSLDHRD